MKTHFPAAGAAEKLVNTLVKLNERIIKIWVLTIADIKNAVMVLVLILGNDFCCLRSPQAEEDGMFAAQLGII
jgi:hypothetical protein